VQFSGSAGPIGGSISHLQFKTDGFGAFNRLDNSVLRGILQADITSSTRIMVEAQQFTSDRQDVLFPAEPFYFAPLNASEDRYRYRFSLRQKFGEAHELLALDAWETAKQISDTLPTEFNGLPEPSRSNFTIKSHSPELQYRFNSKILGVVLGSRYSSVDVIDELNLTRSEVNNHASYLYTYWHLPYRVELELGASSGKQDNINVFSQQQTDHKFGLRWEAIPGGTLRIASFNSVNDTFISNTLLEPTQVAGFHQYYNDTFGSRIYLRGVAWDHRWNSNVAWGIEASSRDLQVPAGADYAQWDERQSRAYVNWALPGAVLKRILPGTEGSLTISYDHTHLLRDTPSFIGSEKISDYRLRQLRLGLTLNHGSGWTFNASLSRVQTQALFQVFALDFSTLKVSTEDRFLSADAVLTYRLPNKWGQISVGALNLSNRRGFQYLELDPQNPRYASERLVYGRLQLSF